MVRAKYRYIVAELISQSPHSGKLPEIDPQKLYWLIKEQVQKFWGDFGSGSMTKLQIKHSDTKTSCYIIQVNMQAYKLVSAILPLVRLVEKRAVKFQIVYIGATMKHSSKRIIENSKRIINKSAMKLKSLGIS